MGFENLLDYINIKLSPTLNFQRLIYWRNPRKSLKSKIFTLQNLLLFIKSLLSCSKKVAFSSSSKRRRLKPQSNNYFLYFQSAFQTSKYFSYLFCDLLTIHVNDCLWIVNEVKELLWLGFHIHKFLNLHGITIFIEKLFNRLSFHSWEGNLYFLYCSSLIIKSCSIFL